MQVSKITFQESTLKQTGTAGKLLMWMQDNPTALRDTTLTQLAKMSCYSLGTSEANAKAMLCKMRNNQMIIKTSVGKRRGKLYINYYHKDIPGYIVERAPQDIQDRVKTMKENLEKDQYIDEVGCIVTKGNNNCVPEKCADGTEHVADDASVSEDEKEQISEKDTGETAKEISIPVLVKRDNGGRNISLTININLNA